MTRKTWGDRFVEKHGNSRDYLTEVLALEFFTEIRRRMEAISMSQTDLAERMGVSQPYVSRLLNYDHNTTIRSLAIIAHALNAEWVHPQLQEKVSAASADDYELSAEPVIRHVALSSSLPPRQSGSGSDFGRVWKEPTEEESKDVDLCNAA